jgi:hypothetical protein
MLALLKFQESILLPVFLCYLAYRCLLGKESIFKILCQNIILPVIKLRLLSPKFLLRFNGQKISPFVKRQIRQMTITMDKL